MSHVMHRLLFVPLTLTALAAAIGCDSDTSTSPTTPTTPTSVTETFAGSIARNGAATHSFAITASGAVAATITALAPDSTTQVGFSLGTWNGVTCQVVLANDQATQGTVIQGNASAAGSLCVRLYDIGTLGNSVSYEVQVVHF